MFLIKLTYHSLLIFVFLFIGNCGSNRLDLPKTEELPLKPLNKKYTRNEFHFKNFSFYIPNNWQFKLDQFYFPNKEMVEKVIEFELKNQLSFGNLKIYENKNIHQFKEFEDFFYKYVQTQSDFDKIVMIQKSKNFMLAKLLLEKKNEYALFSVSLYIGMYFSKKSIYQISIFGSNDFGIDSFSKEAIQIFSNFYINENIDLQKEKFILQGIEVNFQKDWKILKPKKEQIFSFQFLKKPLFFDIYYLGEITSKKSFLEIRENDQIKLFSDLSEISSNYNFTYNELTSKKFGFDSIDFNQMVYSLYIFGFSKGKSSIFLEDQFRVYYLQFKNNVYKIHLWYNITDYKEDYEQELFKIVKYIKFL